mgnify:CR=1 FL=1
MVLARFVVILYFLLIGFIQANVLSITHIRPDGNADKRNAYFIDLLELALVKSQNSEGDFQLIQSNLEMNQSRALKNLEFKQNIDVVWTMTSIAREERLTPIRIPLLKGLLGYRIFIIKKEMQKIFSEVDSVADLQKLAAGQGASWPDTQILKANGFNVVEASEYRVLFNMLERERFDYFPRGVNEPWSEIRAHREKGLVIESNLIIQYPAPIYFFVNKDNLELAERIERGLRIAIKDGSFEDFFRNHPANREIFNLANIHNRRLFKLENPLLPEKTPINEPSLWYQGD